METRKKEREREKASAAFEFYDGKRRINISRFHFA
jgi:hypothetical protein